MDLSEDISLKLWERYPESPYESMAMKKLEVVP
jgi:hypothetical protein